MKYSAFWGAQEPTSLAQAPQLMSYSILKQIEACPKRWCLENGNYSQIWSGRGYPRPVIEVELLGDVVHKMAELITKNLVTAGCSSIRDGNAVSVIRKLGGFGKLIENIIDGTLEEWKNNPRINVGLKLIRSQLCSKQGLIRRKTQQLLKDMSFAPKPTQQREKSSSVGPCLNGAFSELWLTAKDISWCGKVDLVNVDKNSCEIVDYKSGKEREEHGEQLRVYAALWRLDRERNPEGRLADKLAIKYPGKCVYVAPLNDSEIMIHAEELRQKRTDANIEISSKNPRAVVNYDNCHYCGVRQLCQNYWSQLNHEDMFSSAERKKFVDVEMIIQRQHGPSSWECISRVCAAFPTDTNILFRTAEGHTFSPGDQLRVLGCRLIIDNERSDNGHEWVVMATGRQTEVYWV